MADDAGVGAGGKEAQLAEAQRKFTADDLDGAEASARAAGGSAGNAETVSLMARILIKRGNLADAEAMLTGALEKTPEAPDLLFLRATVREALGQYPQAAQDAATCVTIDPADARAHARLASIFRAMKRPDEAAFFQYEVVKLSPGDAGALLTLGMIMKDLGNLDAALELAQAADTVEPGRADVQVALIDFLSAQGRLTESIEVGRRARSAFPADVRVLRNLANSLNYSGAKDEAVATFEDILRLYPDDGYARHMVNALKGMASKQAEASYVAEIFDGAADEFDGRMVDNLRYRVPGLMRRAVTGLTGRTDLSILDLGCGTGLCGITVRDLASFMKGVDLSKGMLEQARNRGIYDELETGDMVSALRRDARAYDVILAGDVLVYFGDLAELMKAAFARLMPSGHFIFSIERGPDDHAFSLMQNARYRHGRAYVENVARDAGFVVRDVRREGLRLENNQPVNGWLFLLGKS